MEPPPSVNVSNLFPVTMLTTMQQQQPPQQAQAYPNVNPYPAGPSDGSVPGPSGSPMPAAGPGAGFPMRSGLAGMQPHSMSSPSNMVPGSGAGLRGGLPEEKNVFEVVRDNTNVYARKFQGLLDRSTPHMLERWVFTGFLFLCFTLVVVLRQGWYIVMCKSCCLRQDSI